MNVQKVWKTVDKSVYNSPDHFKTVHNMVTAHNFSTTNPQFTNILILGLYTGNPQRRKVMDQDEKQPLLPLDERFREAEQYALDLPPPARTPPVLHEEKPCNRLGYCYCPKCNPRWKGVIHILTAWNRHAKGRKFHPAFIFKFYCILLQRL